MKVDEYAKIYGLNKDEDWRNHFRDNVITGRGLAAMYSCPTCKEILSGMPESFENHRCTYREEQGSE